MLHSDFGVFLSGSVMSKLDQLNEKMAAIRTMREEARAKYDAAGELLSKLDTLIEMFEKVRVDIGDDLLLQFITGPDREATDKLIALSIPSFADGTDPLSPIEVAKYARNVLIQSGRPLKRGALVREMEKNGYKIPGKDRNKNLGTILWRHPGLIVSLPKIGYWAKGVELPGIYDPETYVSSELPDQIE